MRLTGQILILSLALQATGIDLATTHTTYIHRKATTEPDMARETQAMADIATTALATLHHPVQPMAMAIEIRTAFKDRYAEVFLASSLDTETTDTDIRVHMAVSGQTADTPIIRAITAGR